MKKNNINIDLDDKIIEFICKETNEDETIVENYIIDIVYNGCIKNNISGEKICISISSANKGEIRKINKEYRDIDRATDVLSFPIFQRDELINVCQETEDKKLKEIELGDIILCLEVIENQAKEYGTGILRETLYMITHGVCHLIGYDHIYDDERKEMREMEEKILNEIGVHKDE